jgi:putative isomerase
MTIAADRHWNTWDSVYPAQMTYLPLGLTVTPCAFAASTGGFTSFPATTPGLTLGRRTIEGSNVALTLEHAGTTLDWRYDKPLEGTPGEETLRGEWRATRFGEWALRFWVMLVFRLDPTNSGTLATWVYDPETGLLSAAAGDRRITVAGEAPPLMATFHDSIEDLEAEFKQYGYFYLGSRGTGGKVAVLRYNLEEMPRLRFAVSVGSEDAARTALMAPPPARSTHCAIWSAGTRSSMRSTSGPICP